MEACLYLEKEIDRLISTFSSARGQFSEMILEAIKEMEIILSALREADEDTVLSDEQVTKIKEILSKFAGLKLHTEHKELHCTVSKLGKRIDKLFLQDYEAITRDNVFTSPDEIKLINNAIAQHYYKMEMHEVADKMAEEANLEIERDTKAFTELIHILKYIDNDKDVGPALAWTIAHRPTAGKLKSQFEFLELTLHGMKYIEIVKKGIDHQADAIEYAKAHFQQFCQTHDRDVQILMGMLVYLPGNLKTSPYSVLVEEVRWPEIRAHFVDLYCNYHNIYFDGTSPLQSCIDAGAIAIPSLLSIKQIMLQRKVEAFWDRKEELPIEINVGDDKHFHSMFACPILRQQATPSNPPVKLICGHVISKEALNKLSNGHRVKCPYCPTKQYPTQARLIYF